MAVGTYDANGIWHYGESDNIAPFSATLNKLADSASSAITADRARLATLEAGSLSGLIPIKPSSVDKSGGSAGISTIGNVSFNGVAYISLNGVFSSLYRTYRVVYTNKGGSTTGAAVYLRFRASGADNTGSAYYYAGNYGTWSGGTGARNGQNATSVYCAWLANSTATYGRTSFDISSPNEATATWFTFQSGSYDTTALVADQISGMFSAPNVFDGFTLFASTGTFSGEITVYGYND